MKTLSFPIKTAASLCIAALLAPLPAAAQNPAGQPGQPPQRQAPSMGQGQPGGGGQMPAFSDKQLEAFAEANKKVQKHRQELEQEMQGVEDQQQAQTLQQEYNSKVGKSLESVGLDVGTYQLIAQAAQGDPALRDKIIKHSNQ